MANVKTELSSLFAAISGFFSKYAVIFSLTFHVIRNFWSFGYQVEDSLAQMKRCFLYLFEIVTLCIVFGPMVMYKFELYFPDDGFSYQRIGEPVKLGFFGTEFFVVLGCFSLILVGYLTYRILCFYEKKPNFYGTMSIIIVWWSFWLLCMGIGQTAAVLIVESFILVYPTDTYCWNAFQRDCIEMPESSFGMLGIVSIIFNILVFVAVAMGALTALIMGYVWLAQHNGISGWRFVYVYNGVILIGFFCIFILPLLIRIAM